MKNRPKFHRNGLISYWSTRYNMWYRNRYPKMVPFAIVKEFCKDDLDKYAKLCPENAKRWGLV